MLMKRLDNIFKKNVSLCEKKNQINKEQFSIIVADLELLIMLTYCPISYLIQMNIKVSECL